ncbi:MAG: radical SAM protein [Defluviitaleaceae bacterium]|nr:radical SAM protein [Defluviitaleaceae bacterium]
MNTLSTDILPDISPDVLVDILSMLPQELATLAEQLDIPKYRTGQIFDWLHNKGVTSFEDMENLPKTLRANLAEKFYIPLCQPIEVQTSQIDGTKKFLLELSDKLLIEAVLMGYSFGSSVCISTQAGCKMGCAFCASGGGGFLRNLSAGEMLAQVYVAQKYAAKADKVDNSDKLDKSNKPENSNNNSNKPDNTGKLSGVVLMGCGEPLDNFDNVVRFVNLISQEKGFNLGKRHITISTCGLVPQIRQLAQLKLPVNLAISLHAPDDVLRQNIMPIAKKYPIKSLLSACQYYVQLTNRRITFEYALISGLNDSENHAKRLAKLLAGILCHVNLIPINATNKNFLPTLREDTVKFTKILQKYNINATIRRTLGKDLDAACGQLRAKRL